MNRILILALFFSVSAWAFPLDQADPFFAGPEGSILSAIPPLDFEVNGRLRKNVDFWVNIYGRYSSQEGVIHDAKYIDHVYEVVHFQGSVDKNTHSLNAKKRKWKSVLLSLHRKQGHPELMDEDELKVYELFKDVEEPNKFLNAAHRRRLRFQLGQKDRFKDGLYQSGRYLPLMEEAFKKEGLPFELTRLPFVESSFNVRARSKVGASGIWQFMRSTARLFLRMNEAVDERNDPIRATEAAAKLLRINYESLRSWPLAVTAYNHGRKGMMRAVRRVGSDELDDVVAEYRSRSFGFASSNFYSELMAAIEVEKNSKKYFEDCPRAEPMSYLEVKLPDFIGLQPLVQHFHFKMASIRELNPGLTEAVFSGRLLVPSGYSLRIPSQGQDKDLVLREFWREYSEIPSSYKQKTQRVTKYGSGTKEKLIRHRRVGS